MVKKAKKSKKKAAKKSAKKTATKTAMKKIQPNYWARVKRELHILICTNDAKYQSIRRLLGKEGKLTQTAMVSGISGAIGAQIGASAAVAVTFVAFGLLALVQVGKEAWCAGDF
jgi:hypothetical protein